MTTNGKQVVTMEFECIDLPDSNSNKYTNLRLGIQKEKEVRQDVLCSVKQVRFHFPLEVTIDPAGDGLQFRGSYVQGSRSEPFVYLCWGERLGSQWQEFRRAKVPLKTLPRQTVEQAFQTRQPIRAKIRMTTLKGDPVAASLKPDYIEWL
jgi:hypothetical protein